MTTAIPTGFQFAGVHSGVKRDATREDLALIVSDRDAVAVGVYTQNRVCAAPVILDRQRTPSERVRAVVVNSGNANACTGEQGMQDAQDMTRLAANACGAEPEQALVMSTGIIGELMPMDKVSRGIVDAAALLAGDEASLVAAARGILTTDTVHKLAGRELTADDRTVRIVGFAKGSGMIGPNMATMLAVVATDAPLTPETAQTLLGEINAETFNCISVDGHTSTNDTVLLLANGAAGGPPLAGEALERFQEALRDVCGELARSIADDGEGATHLIRLEVTGCATRDDAHRIARAVANSPLVKTAIAGADPNWGRIVSAAGYAGVPFDPAGVDLYLNGTLLYEQGAPSTFDPAAVSESIAASRQTDVHLRFREGEASLGFWTTDLTHEYIRINADYHT